MDVTMTTVSFKVDTSPVIGSSKPVSDTYLYNNHYLPYHSTLYNTLLAIHILYIPFIIVPSMLVISTVMLMKKLHNHLNIILLAISAADLLVALVDIPIRVLLDIAVTREAIYSYKHICSGLYISTDAIEMIELSIVSLLGFNTVIHTRYYPLNFRKPASIKRTTASIITIILLHVCSGVIFFGLMVGTNTECTFINNVDKEHNHIPIVYKRIYILGTYVLVLSSCFAFGIYVRCIRWDLARGTTGRIMTCRLMAVVILEVPTLILLMNILNLDTSTNELWMHAARLIRYLSSIFNGLLICYLSPTYRFAFKFFLTTNPKDWKMVQSSFDAYNKTLPALVRVIRSAKDDVCTPPVIDYGPQKIIHLFRDSISGDLVVTQPSSTDSDSSDDAKKTMRLLKRVKIWSENLSRGEGNN